VGLTHPIGPEKAGIFMWLVLAFAVLACVGGVVWAVGVHRDFNKPITSGDPVKTQCQLNWDLGKDNIPQTHADYMKSCVSTGHYLQQFNHDHGIGGSSDATTPGQ
jgi:hypothetical protein